MSRILCAVLALALPLGAQFTSNATKLRGRPIDGCVPTNGQGYTYNTTSLKWECATLAGGSVTSVAQTVPSIFAVAGSPITTTGTLAITLATQTANLGFFGPASGAAAAPTFRAAVAADMPILVDTADKGYMFGVSIQGMEASGSTTAFGLNLHKVWQFVVPHRITVGNIIFEVTTASGPATNLNLGLWNAAATTLVLQTGVLSAAGSPDINATGIKTVAITAVTVDPGVYWLTMTTDSLVLVLRGISPSSAYLNFLNAGAVEKVGNCANDGAAGVFPASCGTVTASSTSPPMVLFQR